MGARLSLRAALPLVGGIAAALGRCCDVGSWP